MKGVAMGERGLVLMVQKRRAVVLLPGGAFRTIKRSGQDWALGQEILVPDRSKWRYGWVAIPVAVALGVFLFGSQGIVTTPTVAAAVVSVDINPSVNLDISGAGRVIQATGLDSSGKRLLRQDPVRGVSATLAVQDLVARAASDGYFTPKSSTLVIGAVFQSKPAKWFSQMSSLAVTTLEQQKVQASVVTISAVSQKLISVMQHPNLSVGRYLLWERETGQERALISMQQLKKIPVSELVHPQASPPAIHPKVSQTPGSASSSSSPPSSAPASVTRTPAVRPTSSSPGSKVPVIRVSVPKEVIRVPSVPKVGPSRFPIKTSRSTRSARSPDSTSPGISVKVPVNPIHTVSGVLSQLGL